MSKDGCCVPLHCPTLLIDGMSFQFFFLARTSILFQVYYCIIISRATKQFAPFYQIVDTK